MTRCSTPSIQILKRLTLAEAVEITAVKDSGSHWHVSYEVLRRASLYSSINTGWRNFMSKRKLDAEREHRIAMEVVVDAYNEEERAMSWYCYWTHSSRFPSRPAFAKPWPLHLCARVKTSRSPDSLMKTCAGLVSSSGFGGANAT